MAEFPTIQELPNTPSGVLRQMDISQTGIDHFSDGLIQEVQEGQLNPLELRAMVKAMEMIIERVNKATQDSQLRAADLFPGDSFEAYGVKFTKADVYTSYNFEGCNDPIWKQRAQILEQAKEQLKERETFLKAIKEPMGIVTEDGESIKINPPNKKSTPGLKLSIK